MRSEGTPHRDCTGTQSPYDDIWLCFKTRGASTSDTQGFTLGLYVVPLGDRECRAHASTASGNGKTNSLSSTLRFVGMRLRRSRKKPPQRGGAYQPKVQPWGWGSRKGCVLKERRIEIALARNRPTTIFGFASKRGVHRRLIPSNRLAAKTSTLVRVAL